MKFNFRKIASVLASTVMLSSTVALAAAANYPMPFVTSGVADVAVVYGTNAASTDLVAATKITTSLNSKLIQTGSATTVSGGDSVKLEKSSNKFNLGENMTDFWTNLQSDQLSKVLADGIYTNDANSEFDFEQKIAISTGRQFKFFQDDDFNDAKPTQGFPLVSGNHILNYTLEFTPDAAEGGTSFADLETTDLTILGRTYYVVDATGVANGVKLTLLDSANSALVTDGETQTITVKSTSYDVKIVFVDATNTILDINGVQTNKLAEGDVFKVGTGTDSLYVGIKNILYSAKESGTSRVEISLGSGKIVLQGTPLAGQEVEVNSEKVSTSTDSVLKAYITNSSTDISKIILEWDADDDMWIAPGSNLVLPGFETIKFSVGSFVTPAVEKTGLENDGDDSLKLTTVLKDGAVSINLLYANDSNYLGLGKASDKLLVTSTSNTLIMNRTAGEKFFVGSWMSGDNAESVYFEYTTIGSDATKNTTTFKNVADSQTYDVNVGDSKDIGELKLTLNTANKATSIINVTVGASGSGNATTDRLYTAGGLMIRLPVKSGSIVPVGSDGIINITNATNTFPATHTVNFTEEDEDGSIALGKSFTVAVVPDPDGPSASAPGGVVGEFDQTDGSDIKESMVQSSLATKLIRDTAGNSNTLDIEYHGDEAYGEIYVSETGAAIVAEGSQSILPVLDSENPTAKNLIVVGGSCINSVAASLLGGPLCGADFEAKTNVGAGSFLIETFARDSGKVATLVAGYNAEDTTNAATYFTTQSVDTTAGKKYTGTSASTATLVVA